MKTEMEQKTETLSNSWEIGFRSNIKQSAFFRRKEALMYRDPFIKDLERKLKIWDPSEGLSQEILSLKKELEKKWAVAIYYTTGSLIDQGGFAQPFPDIQGPLIFGHNFPGRSEVLRAWRLNSEFPRRSRPEKENRMAARSFPIYILPSDDKLVVQIDLNLVDRGEDARFVKNTVADLIDRCLKERNQEGREPLVVGEPKELIFLYHSHEQTFQKYLRWYDLHVGTNYNKPNGFSFRAIAFCEYVLRNYPELYEDAKARIAGSTKVVRTARGERVLKGVVGDHIKGEDAVEKAVKIVYGSIHRTPYPSKKTKQKEFNCPKHGISCPTTDCPYLKRFMEDFNRRTMLFKQLTTTDPAVLPQIISEGRSPSKRKPTADQQSNTK